MSCRRLVGIDLGIASAHTVRVLDETGETITKRKAWPTTESLGEVEAAALTGCPEGTRLEVVMEPTGVSGRSTHPGSRRAQDADQGSGPPAAADDPAHR